MLEYLKVCQDLETFGISYYDVKNKKGTNDFFSANNFNFSFKKIEYSVKTTSIIKFLLQLFLLKILVFL